MQVTKNSLRRAWATVRYDVGFALEKVLYSRRDRFPRLYRWAHAAEAAQNCIIDPWLGKVSRQEQREMKYGRMMLDLGRRIQDTPEGPEKERLRVRYRRASEKAVAASVARAYLTIERHPDYPESLHTIRMHEFARARA